MSSAEVRAYLETLPGPEQKKVSTELYRAMLSIDLKQSESPQQQFSK